jgi:putative hydrolase
VSWDAARQLAITVATEGRSEDNVVPAQRIAIEELARVADLHVQDATGLSTVVDGRAPAIAPVNRTTWATRTLDAYRSLLETVATSIANASSAGFTGDPTEAADDPAFAFLAPMMKALNPMLIGLTAGSMVGHLASRALGTYDVPVPRVGNEVMIVVPNVKAFADDWSLPLDELQLWICVHELCHHAVLNVAHVKDRLNTLLRRHGEGFVVDHQQLQDRLGEIDITSLMQSPDPSSLGELQGLLSNPDLVLGAVQSPAQRALLPQIEALICAVVGYVDHTMDSIGHTLISSYPQLTEALRRRRVETDASDRFVERVLGFNLTQTQYDRGRRFVEGVVERAGTTGLARLWEAPRTLPTPSEIDAPGLWLARLEFD